MPADPAAALRRAVRRLLAALQALAGLGLLVWWHRTAEPGRVDAGGRVLVWLVALALLGSGLLRWRARPAAARPALAPSDGAVLVVADLAVTRAGRRVLDGVSVVVRPGESVALLGRNGAGKSTLVAACCGQLPVDGGRVAVNGHPVGSAQARASMGVVPQDSALYAELTARENLRVAAALYDVTRPERVGEVLAVLGLTGVADVRAGRLSGGQRRRLALAMALLHDPALLFLDEPTLGVDAHGRQAFWQELRALQDQGRAIVMTTNQLDEAAAVCDRVVVLHGGVVVADDRPDALRDAVGLRLRLRVADPVAARRVLVGADLEPDVEPGSGDDVLEVPVRDDEAAAQAIDRVRSVTEVLAVRVLTPSVDEAFRVLTADPT